MKYSPRAPTEAAPLGIAHAFRHIGGKHKAVILWVLRDGSLRFSRLRAHLSPLSEGALSKVLRELAASGLLTRTVFAIVPPRVEYALTERGRALLPALAAINEWSTA